MKCKQIFGMIVVCLFFWGAVGAQAEDADYLKLAGVGVMLSSSPYKGEDSKVFGAPIGIWRNDRFFLEGIKAGMILAEDDMFRADAVFSPRFMGYENGDVPILQGMEDRDWSIDGGVQFKWKIPEVDNLDAHVAVLTDVLGRHDGYEVQAGLSKILGKKYFQLVPSIGVKWQSEELNDYYFGVRSSEAIAGRPSYGPDGGLNYYANLSVYTGFSKDWFVLIRGGMEWLSSEIKDSPLVDEQTVYSGMLGIAYRF